MSILNVRASVQLTLNYAYTRQYSSERSELGYARLYRRVQNLHNTLIVYARQ